jgi:hypothetical protein
MGGWPSTDRPQDVKITVMKRNMAGHMGAVALAIQLRQMMVGLLAHKP